LIVETRRQNRQDRVKELLAMYVGSTFEYEEDDAFWSTVQSYSEGKFGVVWSGHTHHIEWLSPEELLQRILIDLNHEEQPDLVELIAMLAEAENEEETLDWWLSCSLLCRK
jgi:hypothetical protein